MAGRRFGCAFALPTPLRDFAPTRMRLRKRAYAYRGLRAFASLSMARSDGKRDMLGESTG
jgi:hypothetical protein